MTKSDDLALKAALDEIHHLSFIGLGGHFFALLLWITVVFEQVQWVTIIWLFLPQTLVLFCRAILVLRYKKLECQISTRRDLRRWEAFFAIGAALTGLVWGGSFFLISDLDTEYHFVFYAMVICLTAAGTTTLGAVFKIYLAFMFSILGMTIFWTTQQHGFIYNATTSWTLFFVIFAFVTVRRYANSFERAIVEKELAKQKHDSLELVTKELLANAERFNRWMESNFIGIIQQKSDGEIVSVNNTILSLLGYSLQEFEDGKINADSLTPEEFKKLDRKAVSEASKKGFWTPYEKEYLHKDGTRIPVLLGGSIFHKDSQEFIVFVVDLTERKNQEEQIRRSQKMDALGKLTGGVAHDYNNMLGVILGYADLLKIALKDQPELEGYVTQIQHAGHRGAALTKKILSFSSNTSAEVEVISINSLLRDQQQMIEKALTVRIELTYDLENHLWPISVDVNDIGDTILNICINAMHAMQDKQSNPRLTIQTKNVVVAANSTLSDEIEPGDYVRLSFTDTGFGMDQHTIDKIFDPFFSTKGTKGTGLGLAQVYGFLKRANGTIKVYSKLGQGSQFELYFPRYIADLSEPRHPPNETVLPISGKENILIVDDEVSLLDLTKRLLERQGYHTYVAQNSIEALNVLETEAIDLMISDIIMPGMDGIQLANIVLKEYPEIKVLLVSGFSGEQDTNMKISHPSHAVIQKPYNAVTLYNRVRKVLDGG